MFVRAQECASDDMLQLRLNMIDINPIEILVVLHYVLIVLIVFFWLDGWLVHFISTDKPTNFNFLNQSFFCFSFYLFLIE